MSACLGDTSAFAAVRRDGDSTGLTVVSMRDLAPLRELIFGAVGAPEEVLEGASAEDLTRLEERLQRNLPDELAALLSLCNGGAIGPGGIYGQRPENVALDLPSVSALFPEWTERNWLPVAGDGCGNYWVLLC